MELQAQFNRQVDDIQRKLRECNADCNRLKDLIRDRLAPLEAASQKPWQPETILQQPVEVLDTPVAPPSTSVEIPAPESVVEPGSEPEALVPEPIAQTPSAVPPPIPEHIPKTRPAARAAKAQPKPKAAPKERGSMEKFIGENLLNKIGIGILVIGVGIFVKYAIDQDWIGPIGRVLIGLATGGILLGVAHRLRKTYAAFSSVLVGGGIATLYFTVGIGYHTYDLFPQMLAFGLMCGITAFGVVMAVGYDRKEIAVISLLGGFGTPFMVSNGEGNYLALLSYTMLLNIGMLSLSWLRRWPIVRILSYAMTVLIFGGWLAYNLLEGVPEISGNLGFALAFFLVFFAAHIAFAVRKKEKLHGIDFILLLSNSALFYGAVMCILHYVDGGRYQGIFTALMGVFHFAFIFPVRKWVHFDPRLVTVMVGMVLTFVTLAVPIQLEGSYMTLFWAVEAVVVLVLSGRTGLKVLETGALLLAGLSVVSLVNDWSVNYMDNWGDRPTAFLNGAFVTSLVTSISLFAIRFIYLRKEGGGNKGLASLFRFIGFPVLYFGLLLELTDQLDLHTTGDLVGFGFLGLTPWFLAAMALIARAEDNKVFGTVVTALSVGFYLLLALAQVAVLSHMGRSYLNDSPGGDGFGWHAIAYAGAMALLALNFMHVKRYFSKSESLFDVLLWAFALVFVAISSFWLDNLLAMGGIPASTSHKAGYPILWGVIGFGLIAVGMRQQLRSLRIAGLALFLLIIVKLFAYDIRSVSTGGKIAAFISLGVLLLVVSFMYQRLKKLLVDEKDTQAENQESDPQN